MVVFHLVHRDLFDHIQRDEGSRSFQNGQVYAGDLAVVLPDVDAAVFFLIAVNGDDDLIADEAINAIDLTAAHQGDSLFAGGAGTDEIFHPTRNAFTALLAAGQHKRRKEVIVNGDAVGKTVKERLYDGLQVAAAQHGSGQRLLQLVDIPQGLCLIIDDGGHDGGDDLGERDAVGNLEQREAQLIAEIEDVLRHLIDVAVELQAKTHHAVFFQLRDQLHKLGDILPDSVGGGNQQLTAGYGTDDVGIDHDADRGNDLIGAGSTGQQAGIMQDIHAENSVHRDAVIGIHACRPLCGSAAAEIVETGSSCLLLTHVLSNSYSTIK